MFDDYSRAVQLLRDHTIDRLVCKIAFVAWQML